MNNTGLVCFCGIPGSGKTLLSVVVAKSHYKFENSIIKFYLSYLKYNLIKFLNRYSFIKNIYDKIYTFFNKLFSIKIIKFIFICLKLFVYLCLFIYCYVGSNNFIKIIFISLFLFYKPVVKFFNSLDYDYYSLFPDNKINNVYSSFPILLDKKNKIYSNKLSLYDLNSNYSFYPNALLIIDEVQLFVDSDEYNDKEQKKEIAKIAKFLQSHRHFGIKQIIYISQSPSRIFKKARNITVGYLKLFKVINLPLIPISIFKGIMYYDFEFYGRYIPKDREERKKLPFEYKKFTRVFLRTKAYESYDSRYLSGYNYGKPLLSRGVWDTPKVDDNMLNTMFND